MGGGAKKDFFISYTGADRAWAEWIAWQLEDAGRDVVLQAWDFGPGSNFVVEMDRAALEAERTLLVVSARSLASGYVEAEWAARLREDPGGKGRRLLPVRIEACDVKGLLGSIVYIDLVGLEPGAAAAALLGGVASGRHKPAAAPAFPGGAPHPVSSRGPRFPHSLPDVWNVPYLRNPNFTGREELLAGLHDSLTTGEPASIRQALAGLGGVGKTQLAVEYAYRNAGDYDVVWWVRSEAATTLAADYAGAAYALGLLAKDIADQKVAAEAAKQWFGTHSRWLLVFDNAESPDDLVDFMPSNEMGHVLITSRNRAWRRHAHGVSVSEMTPHEARTFLMARTGRTNQDDENEAAELAEELGWLPLALEHAAAYVEAVGISFGAYLERFRSAGQDVRLLGEAGPDSSTVMTTWAVSLDRVRQTRDAEDLIRFCACLGPDRIPLDLLLEDPRWLPPGLASLAADQLALDKAIRALLRYSLIDREDNDVTVHRLVQLVVRESWIDKEAQRPWIEAAVIAVKHAFPDDASDYRSWSKCARLLVHAIVSAERARRFEVVPLETAALCQVAGVYECERSQNSQAVEHLGWALEARMALLGPDAEEVAETLTTLARAYHGAAQLAKALQSAERALAIRDRAPTAESAGLVATLTILADTLIELADPGTAVVHLERAFQLTRQRHGHVGAEVGRILDGLAIAHWRLGNFGRALESCTLAHENWLKSASHQTAESARTQGHIAQILCDLHELEEARKSAESARATLLTLFPNDRTLLVVRAEGRVGIVLARMGMREQAEEILRASWQALEKMQPGHPNAAGELIELAECLVSLNPAEARKDANRGLGVFERVYGDDHPYVAKSLAVLGMAERADGKLVDARHHLQSALSIFGQHYPRNHPATLEWFEELARVDLALGDPVGSAAALEGAGAARARLEDERRIAGL